MRTSARIISNFKATEGQLCRAMVQQQGRLLQAVFTFTFSNRNMKSQLIQNKTQGIEWLNDKLDKQEGYSANPGSFLHTEKKKAYPGGNIRCT